VLPATPGDNMNPVAPTGAETNQVNANPTLVVSGTQKPV